MPKPIKCPEYMNCDLCHPKKKQKPSSLKEWSEATNTMSFPVEPSRQASQATTYSLPRVFYANTALTTYYPGPVTFNNTDQIVMTNTPSYTYGRSNIPELKIELDMTEDPQSNENVNLNLTQEEISTILDSVKFMIDSTAPNEKKDKQLGDLFDKLYECWDKKTERNIETEKIIE